MNLHRFSTDREPARDEAARDGAAGNDAVGESSAWQQSRNDRDELEKLCGHNLLTATDEIIYFKDLHSRFILLSRAWGAMTGRDPEELLGLTDFDIFDHEHASAAYADEQQIIATGIPVVNKQEREVWSDRASNRWVTTTKVPLRDADGKIIGTFGISRDITRLVDAEAEANRNAEALAATLNELRRVENQLRTVLDTSPDAIALYDNQLRYQYVNASAEQLLGERGPNLLGRTDRQCGLVPDILPVWEPALARVLATGESSTVDLSIGGGPNWRGFQAHLAAYHEVTGGAPIGVLASIREVTELRLVQDKLAYQALHDPVTGLANRVLLMDRLAQALRRAGRHPRQVALLFIDLDGFKEVNDTFGHGAGDQLLVEVGRCLTGLTRQGDTVARFGGDEFVLLCEDLSVDEDVRGIAERTVRELAKPFTVHGNEVYITASVGVVVAGEPQVCADDLVRDADAAMYQAKERGRNRFQFFDAVLRKRAAARYAVETDLARALDNNEFRLEYQPVFSLENRQIIGAEALIRWDHPTRGLVPPVEFIDVAESRGLIVPIGTWVLNEACRQLAAWSAGRDPALPPLMMAVNVSVRQLRVPGFADLVKAVLGRHQVAAGQLCLEITETALLEEAADAHDILTRLSDVGVQIALDDFGTGYSSLAHLLELPVDMIKIDRSFVAQLGSDHRGREIVTAVTAMAHALGMSVVGEGIESTDQLDRLRELGCDHGQGYLLARPQRPEALTDLLGLP